MPDPFQPDAETVRRIVEWLRSESDRKEVDATQDKRELGQTLHRAFGTAYRLTADAIARGDPFRNSLRAGDGV